jgi:tetratricopeptide (TPR) repeat protein
MKRKVKIEENPLAKGAGAKRQRGGHGAFVRAARPISEQPMAAPGAGVRVSSQASKQVWEEAIDHYSKRISANPLDSEAYSKRGQAWQEIGNFARALDDLGKATALSPDFADAYYWKGLAKSALGDSGGALEDFSRAIELNPRFGYAYFRRSRAKAALGDNRGTLEDLNMAIKNGINVVQEYLNDQKSGIRT